MGLVNLHEWLLFGENRHTSPMDPFLSRWFKSLDAGLPSMPWLHGNCYVLLLMAEILHQFIASLSHYL